MANFIYNNKLFSRNEISLSNKGNLDVFQFGNLIFNDNVLIDEAYWRSMSAGATYLDLYPYLHIREGQVVGNNIEYNDLGKFMVKDIKYDGYDKNTISITSVGRVSTMENRKKLLSKEYGKKFYYYNNFDDKETIKDFDLVVPEIWGISNSQLICGITNNMMDYVDQHPSHFVAMLNGTGGLEDYIISTGVKFGADFLKDDASVGIMHKIHNTYSAPGYPPELSFLSYISPATPHSPTGSYYSIINGITVRIPAGKGVYLTSVVYNGKFLNYYGFDRNTMFYTNRGILYGATDTWSTKGYKSGAVGIGHKEDEVFHSMEYDFLEVREIGPEYTKGKIINDVISQDGLYFKVPAQNIGLSDFRGLSCGGFTYELGVTNGGLQLNMGSSAMTIYMGRFLTGPTFNNFTMEFDFKYTGYSGGLMLRAGFMSRMSPSASGSDNVSLAIRNTLSSEQYDYNGLPDDANFQGNLVTINNDVWHRCRFVKDDARLSLYVNNTLVKQARGVSLDVLRGAGSIMLGTGGLGRVNYRLSIRNLIIESMMDAPDSVQLNSDDKIGNDLNRLFPHGYKMNSLGSSIELLQLGLSMRSFNSGDIIRISHTNNLNKYMKFLYAKGNGVAVTYINPDDKISLNGLLSENAKTKDGSITNKSALEEYGNYDLKREMKDSEIFNIVTLHRPNWNIFDNVLCEDYVTGMSGNYHIDTTLKRYSAEGEYLQYTTLKPNVIQ